MERVSGLQQFFGILSKPDNIPIAGMLILVFFFTWIGLKQARRNDQLIEQGRADEILKEMASSTRLYSGACSCSAARAHTPRRTSPAQQRRRRRATCTAHW